MGRKLDLSKLSDDEAKHVWEVIQRDFSLRKKEEERLEDLKHKVEKESSKRELLSSQRHLNQSHCINCLQPFQFLLNSKRPCLDCQFHVCKNCSRYNKKEQGWVCDTCRVTRMVKLGSVNWYHEHVQSRFKRFGSDKVMRCLYPRLHSDPRGGAGLSGLHDKVYSLPDINREYMRQTRAGVFQDGDDTEDLVDSTEVQRCSMMRKTKRLLSVHPFDFEMDSEYSAQSRRQSTLDQDIFQSFSEETGTGKDKPQKESMIAEADLASMFHYLLQEQGHNLAPPDQEFNTEVRFSLNSRRRSLESNRRPCSPSQGLKGSHYSGDMDTSEEEGGAVPKPHPRRRSRASSQENVHSGGQSTGAAVHTDADLEEETLKRKIGELASNLSDKGGSSDEEKSPKIKVMTMTSSEGHQGQEQVYLGTQKPHGLVRLLDTEERALQSTTTDSELSELEVSVASAMAQVQQTESEVSDIESRIAALSAAGMTVTPSERAKRKSSSRVFATAISRSTEPFQPEASNLQRLTSTPSEEKMLALQEALQKKFNIDPDMLDGSFERNALYRGSLTQRNPNGKNRKADRIFAKPVLMQR
ncbi:melanophilin isoform X4 [Bombina bombina]|uniref:melanophilin isoform X4 n=1 Tax=Bombina bombina TaxID=8345 RepID=UPI00235B01E1|nr:melanophilin isoform X4 [Bombina bombina]